LKVIGGSNRPAEAISGKRFPDQGAGLLLQLKASLFKAGMEAYNLPCQYLRLGLLAAGQPHMNDLVGEAHRIGYGVAVKER